MGISIGQDRARIGTQLYTNEKSPDLFATQLLSYNVDVISISYYYIIPF